MRLLLSVFSTPILRSRHLRRHLASADSDYMTGQSVMIDGGVQFS